MNASPLALVVESLGWTLLHFVWQGALIAATLYCLLALARGASAGTRYLTACAALFGASAVFGLTLAWQIDAAERRADHPDWTRAHSAAPELAATGATGGDGASISPDAGPPAGTSMAVDGGAVGAGAGAGDFGGGELAGRGFGVWPGRLRQWLPTIVGLWAAGVGLLSLRLIAGWRAIRRVRSGAREIDDAVCIGRFADLRGRLGVSRTVRLLSSASATVPFVVGWLRPVVLVPAGLLTGLNAGELEAIFAHELAHIRRHDFLVNLLQNVVETLLFYHPAVWWMSAQIRRERENCCDDAAAAVSGGALDYAKALVALERLRGASDLVVAATGGSLLARVRRLAGLQDPSRSAWPLAALLLVLGALLALLEVGRSSREQQQVDMGPPVDESTWVAAESPLRIRIGRAPSGEIETYLNGQRTDEGDLKRLVADLVRGDDKPAVLLAADKGVDNREVIGLIDLLSSLGLHKVSLETRHVTADAGSGKTSDDTASEDRAGPTAGDGAEVTAVSRGAGIVVAVVDAATKEPLPRFRVLSGVAILGVPDAFKAKHPGLELTRWQPESLRLGENGISFWPADPRDDEMKLRVEADGYRPQATEWIRRPDRAVTLVVRMVADAGWSGRILQPDGQPAADATVAIVIAGKLPNIVDGQIWGDSKPPDKLRWQLPTTARTDAEGRFRLPSETDPSAAVLAVHASGVADLRYADLDEQPEIRLKPWGRIEGQVLWKDRPGADEIVGASLHRTEEYGYPGIISQNLETHSDAQGKFVLDKVLPGRVRVSRFVQTEMPPGARVQFRIQMTTVEVDHQFVDVGGKPTAVLIGGQGRTVRGRLTGRDTWDGVTFSFAPETPHWRFNRDIERNLAGEPVAGWKPPWDLDAGDEMLSSAYWTWAESPVGPLFFRDKLTPNADGTFEIPDVLPGDYWLVASAPETTGDALGSEIRVEAERPGEAPPPLDVGEIKIRPADVPEIAATVNAAAAPASPVAEATAETAPPVIPISVVDAATGKPIPRFRVLLGIKFGGGPFLEKFKAKHPGVVPMNWLPNDICAGENGKLAWPFDWRGHKWFDFALRVEAEGYVPEASALFSMKAPLEQWTCQLKADPGVEGRVLEPSGKPAAGATVAIALARRTLWIDNGQIMQQNNRKSADGWADWQAPVVVKTDAEGRYRLPTETELSAVVVVVHDSGASEMDLADFVEQREITLAHWGRIEGRILWKDQPGADEPIKVRIDRRYYANSPMVWQYRETRSDREGKFVVDKLLPGRVQFWEGPTDVPPLAPPGQQFVDVGGDGEPTPLLIGGQGRTVKCRLVGRDSWDGVTVRFLPERFNFPGRIPSPDDYARWKQSPSGRLLIRDKLEPEADGSLEISDVLPGRYRMIVFAGSAKSSIGGQETIDVPEEQAGEAAPPVDLGEIKVKGPDKPTSVPAGEAAQPEAEVSGRVLEPDGKPAVEATVALATAKRPALLKNGRIAGEADAMPAEQREPARGPILAKTDREGRFRLPVETDPGAAVLIVHGSGAVDMSYADFRRQPEMRLKRWGRIEGQVLWKDHVGADAVSISSSRDQYAHPKMIADFAEIRTDPQGKFVFDHVLPGRVKISGCTALPQGEGLMSVEVWNQFVEVGGAGEPTPVIVAEQGRTGAPKLPERFEGSEIIARVGPEVILASDVLPDANHHLQKIIDRAPQPPPADDIERLRKLYMSKFLERQIEIKLVIAEGRGSLPKEAWEKIERQFNEQFDKEYLKKMIDSEECRSRAELDAKLRKQGSSLEAIRRQAMENSFAQHWLDEKVRDDREITADETRDYYDTHPDLAARPFADVEAEIRKRIHDDLRRDRRQLYRLNLSKKIPVWNIFAAAAGDVEAKPADKPDGPTSGKAESPATGGPAGKASEPAAKLAPESAAGPADGADSKQAEVAEKGRPISTCQTRGGSATAYKSAASKGESKQAPVKITVAGGPDKVPIARFRVMTGVRPHYPGGDQTHAPPTNWRICPVRIGENGGCLWAPDQGPDNDYQVLVEADGYRETFYGWIRGGLPSAVEFHLNRLSTKTIHITEPGKDIPAVRATVAVATPRRHAILENDHIRGDSFAVFQNESEHWGDPAFEQTRLDRPWLVKTDSDGTFQFDPEAWQDAQLVIVHPSGALEWGVGPDGRQSVPQTLSLDFWASVVGKVVWQDQVGAKQRIGLSIDDSRMALIGGGPHDVFSDASGSFSFSHVLPSRVHVSRFVAQDDFGPDAQAKRITFDGLDAYVSAKRGGESEVLIGGQGRTVVGRLVGRKDWEGVTFSFAPPMPAVATTPEGALVKEQFDLWAASSIGPIYFRKALTPAADGKFEIPKALPGRYELSVSTPEAPEGATRAEITIEPEDPQERRPHIDVGDIPVNDPKKGPGRPVYPELFRGDVGDLEFER